MDPSAPDLTGTILDDKYLIVRELGCGGMGVVYEGRHLLIERRVAIKMLLGGLTSHPDAVERFEREARASAPIAHPSIVDVLDMGRTETGRPYIVMEHLDGEVLFERLRRVGPMLPTEAVGYVAQVLDALSAAHAAGVVHRDVKPENVFLVRRGEEESVKILDFGVAMFSAPRSTSGRITRAGNVLGTPGYMSPEQALGATVDQRTDVYSTGVMLYELLSGKLPEGEEGLDPYTPISGVAPNVPAALARVVGRALMRSPAARFQTAAEFLEALRSWQRGSIGVAEASAPSVGSLEASRETMTIRRPRGRSGWVAVALTLAGLVAATCAARRETESAIGHDERLVILREPRLPSTRPTVVSYATTASSIPRAVAASALPARAARVRVVADARMPDRVGRTRPVLPFTNVY